MLILLKQMYAAAQSTCAIAASAKPKADTTLRPTRVAPLTGVLGIGSDTELDGLSDGSERVVPEAAGDTPDPLAEPLLGVAFAGVAFAGALADGGGLGAGGVLAGGLGAGVALGFLVV